MVAYHFPPLAGSSGIQRTLRFAQHLPKFGWRPIVLSADPRAYERTSDDLMNQIPADAHVCRAFALDTARHLSLAGRYLGFMARPDRWVSWKFDAVRQGLRLIDRYRPAAIWSTYPIATAHLIGDELRQRTGLPWLADFRDPMAQPGYPADPLTYKQYVAIEGNALANARFSVFTTSGAAGTYRERYPAAAGRVQVIENGYDEEAFSAVERTLMHTSLHRGRLTLLHSGIVYPQERDPSALFAALGRLKRAGRIGASTLCLRFRAAVHDDLLRRLASENDITDVVEVQPAIPYENALEEMCRADGLLVLQAGDCNDQIPGKVYEYLRANRPILCLADPNGDTHRLIVAAGVSSTADLSSSEEIEVALLRFLGMLLRGEALRPKPEAIRDSSRLHRTRQLAEILDRVAA